ARQAESSQPQLHRTTSVCRSEPQRLKNAHRRCGVDHPPNGGWGWGLLGGGGPQGEPDPVAMRSRSSTGGPGCGRPRTSGPPSPSLPPTGGLSLTDLLASRSRLGASDLTPARPPTATARMVLDTSVLIADPESIRAFPDADVVIPLVVVEELDEQKGRLDDVGRAARAVLRAIEELRVANGGDIRTPVALPDGGTVRIETNGLHLNEIREHGLDPAKNDNRILAAALGQATHGPTVIVSNDAALRIKAAQLGLEAREHQRLRGRASDVRPVGWTTVEVSAAAIDAVYDDPHGLPVEALPPADAARLG